MVVTVLQIVVPVLVALVAAFAGAFRGPKARRRAAIEKDVEILGKLPDGAGARDDVLALIRYEVQKLQQLEGYVTEEQVELPAETTLLLQARESASRERHRSRSWSIAFGLFALGLAMVVSAYLALVDPKSTASDESLNALIGAGGVSIAAGWVWSFVARRSEG